MTGREGRGRSDGEGGTGKEGGGRDGEGVTGREGRCGGVLVCLGM